MSIRPRAATDGAALEAMASETHRVDGYPKYLPGERYGWSRVGRVEWTLPGDLPLRELVYVAPG